MANDEDEPSERDQTLENYRKTASDKDLQEMNQMVYQMRKGLGGGGALNNPPPAAPEIEEEPVDIVNDGAADYVAAAPARRGDKLIRTLQALLNFARLPNMRKALREDLTLTEIAKVYDEGRGPFMTFLKTAGVRNITDRQGLTQAVSSAKNLDTLRPYLDEAAAIAAELAGAIATPSDMTTSEAKPEPTSCLVQAGDLKERGNALFKEGGDKARHHMPRGLQPTLARIAPLTRCSALSARPNLGELLSPSRFQSPSFPAHLFLLTSHLFVLLLVSPPQLPHAIDAYSDAIHAAETAMAGPGSGGPSKAEAATLLTTLHSNTAAALLKLERWEPAAKAATRALKLEPGNTKALYRRGVARHKLWSLFAGKGGDYKFQIKLAEARARRHKRLRAAVQCSRCSPTTDASTRLPRACVSGGPRRICQARPDEQGGERCARRHKKGAPVVWQEPLNQPRRGGKQVHPHARRMGAATWPRREGVPVP